MVDGNIDDTPLTSVSETPGSDGIYLQAASVAEYVAEMASELARMAKGARLSTLAYLLGMVAIEAKRKGGH